MEVEAEDAHGNSDTEMYEVTVPAGPAKTLIYDDDGNLMSDGARTFEWDSANRLVAIEYTGDDRRTEFTYDGFGRRVAITEKDGVTVTSDRRFLWDELEIIEERNAAGSTTTKRFFGQGEQRIGGADAGTYYYTYDHLGSIREVVNTAGAVQARYDYGLWGERQTLSGTFNADFGFTGHFWHEASGLYLAPYRAYDAELGRWLSRDPIGESGGVNLYGYVGNNPASNWDPHGLFGWRDAAGFVPVLGSGLDAYDSFKCGNWGQGLIHSALAVSDLTGAGAIAKGLTVGTMKFAMRRAVRSSYKNTSSWGAMRKSLQRSGAIARNSRTTPYADVVSTDHIFFKQASGTPHWLLNHPANLQTGVPQPLNQAFESMGALERATHLPQWMKAGANGGLSYGAGLGINPECE